MSSVASLRQIRRRIRSVENTKKITRAMEMVAAAKLRRFQDFLESARPYTEGLTALLEQLLDELPANYHHPYLDNPLTPTPKRGEAPSGLFALSRKSKQILVVVFTSDTGLCGTYNSELEASVQRWVKENSDKKIRFVFVGKHGAGVLQRKTTEALVLFSDLRVSRVDEIFEGLKKTLETAFLEGGAGEIHAAYTRMRSLARFQPTTERLLPLTPTLRGNVSDLPSPPEGERVKGEGVNYLIEPDSKTVLDKLIPTFFEAKLRFIFYHALLSEQIARMNAMRQATKNAGDMIDELTLLRNKARQASITKEIIEVVSGSRALRLK